VDAQAHACAARWTPVECVIPPSADYELNELQGNEDCHLLGVRVWSIGWDGGEGGQTSSGAGHRETVAHQACVESHDSCLLQTWMLLSMSPLDTVTHRSRSEEECPRGSYHAAMHVEAISLCWSNLRREGRNQTEGCGA
jgi:hypothetical protein